MRPASKLAHWIEIAREAIGVRGIGTAPRDDSARKFRALVVDEIKATAELKPAAPPRTVPPAPHPQAVVRARGQAEMPPLEWEAPVVLGATPRGTRRGSEFIRRKIRERYLDVRFPGTPHTEADLRNTAGVVKSARLHFEDGDIDRATELLEFAGDASPLDEAIALAHLEILYLAGRNLAYRDAAWAHRERFPASGHWAEIMRLGARLLPHDLLFSGAKPVVEDPTDHYGAWPRVQNWIQAPFDLTGDVLAAEFHGKLRGGVAAPPITAKASGR